MSTDEPDVGRRRVRRSPGWIAKNLYWEGRSLASLLLRLLLRLLRRLAPGVLHHRDRGTNGEVGDVRAIAFYLPQFHPIPENDQWWGEGFTEWWNVARARPQFRGHIQPRIPADLGFYDLRAAETRQAQAQLASDAGIDGFCYWHYWFHGKRLLSRPFDEVMATGQPNFPFALCWANESWTRSWIGGGEVLIEQTYSEEDDASHAAWLAQTFADPRYLSVDHRKLFLVYRPQSHPEITRFITLLHDACDRRQLAPPFLIGVNGWDRTIDATTLGFDATLDFQPQLGDLPFVSRPDHWPSRTLHNALLGHLTNKRIFDEEYFRATMAARRRRLPHRTLPTVLVGWDNSPRRGGAGTMLARPSPRSYERALRQAVQEQPLHSSQPHLVFINAWNEWAEGNYLEPDLHFGHQYLDATRSALKERLRNE